MFGLANSVLERKLDGEKSLDHHQEHGGKSEIGKEDVKSGDDPCCQSASKTIQIQNHVAHKQRTIYDYV